MEFTRFDWDPAKDLENFAKHEVFFAEAQLAFLDPSCIVTEDLDHSDLEPRFFCFGRVASGILTVRFTRRAGVIRIIGAGFWRKGKAIYERENSLYR